MSSHGELPAAETPSGAPSSSWPTICCIHVVPDLPNVSMTTSSERNLKLFQRVESTIAVWTSRVFFGQAILLARFVAFFFVFFAGTGHSRKPRDDRSGGA